MATTMCSPYNGVVSWIVNHVKQRHRFIQNPLITLELNLRPKEATFPDDVKKRRKDLAQLKADLEIKRKEEEAFGGVIAGVLDKQKSAASQIAALQEGIDAHDQRITRL
ncbi:hypothetical protein BDZ45DRAFT_744605 [Acephala macrosclerotiorum]|nr:hypothetical protein BDZ45DRAFT_744605 [Acephala macrosclerotiorum]